MRSIFDFCKPSSAERERERRGSQAGRDCPIAKANGLCSSCSRAVISLKELSPLSCLACVCVCGPPPAAQIRRERGERLVRTEHGNWIRNGVESSPRRTNENGRTCVSQVNECPGARLSDLILAAPGCGIPPSSNPRDDVRRERGDGWMKQRERISNSPRTTATRKKQQNCGLPKNCDTPQSLPGSLLCR